MAHFTATIEVFLNGIGTYNAEVTIRDAHGYVLGRPQAVGHPTKKAAMTAGRALRKERLAAMEAEAAARGGIVPLGPSAARR